MTRPLTQPAEVVRCGHDPATEELVPDAVDHDPGGQRMILHGELPGELQAPGASVLQRGHGKQFGQVSPNAFPG